MLSYGHGTLLEQRSLPWKSNAPSLSHSSPSAGHLDVLKEAAAQESNLDRLLGSNCYTKAVKEIITDCRNLDQELKTRLALRLTNCQQVHG